MPELPEVETVVRSLRPVVVGRRILNAEFGTSRVMRGLPADASESLRGQQVLAVERYGKFIAIRLDRGCLVVHLGMTGQLLADAEPGKWTHVVLTLDHGTVLYDDPRQFGRIEYGPDIPERVAALGPEPLEVTAQELAARLKPRRSPTRAVLLNQAVLRGVGNIYADEALFRAGIRPKRLASGLKRDAIGKLHASIQEVLSEAIESRGSSISNYVDAEGQKGSFQNSHRVYQRTDEPCVVCGTPIRKIIVGQRSTHYCPKCQH